MEYCRFCGTQLADGQLCTCEKAVAAANQAAANQAAANQAAANQTTAQPEQDVFQKMKESEEYKKAVNAGKEVAGTILGQVKEVVMNPAEGCKAMVKSKVFANGIILAAAQVVMMVIFVMSYYFRQATIESLLTYGRIFAFDMPFFKAFVFTFSSATIAAGVYFGAYFGGFMLMGHKVDIKEVFCLMGVRSIPAIALQVVSVICLMLKPGVGFVMLFASMIAGVIATSYALEGIEGMDKSKKIKLQFVVEIAAILIIFAIMTAMSMLFFPTFNYMFS